MSSLQKDFRYEVSPERDMDKFSSSRVAVVGIIMGSQSDWPTMRKAAETIDQFGIYWERRIISAHRTPERTHEYARTAEARGLKIIIAGAGGAAHLPGVIAASTTLPVHGVPIKSDTLNGVDSLYSMVQMPKGVPVATFSIGGAGAMNAALHAIRMLALTDPGLKDQLRTFIKEQSEQVPLVPKD